MRSLLISATVSALLVATTLNAQAADSQPKPKPAVPVHIDTSFSFVDLTPQQGELPTLLKAEFTKAAAQHRTPFVELGATWCGPCHHLQDALGDTRMIDAFKGTYIIHLDVDAWKGHLETLGFVSDGIPAFFPIDPTGKAIGPVITGDAWGEDIPENMAPPLKKFFLANRRKA